MVNKRKEFKVIWRNRNGISMIPLTVRAFSKKSAVKSAIEHLPEDGEIIQVLEKPKEIYRFLPIDPEDSPSKYE